MGFTLFAVQAMEALAAARGRPVSTVLGIPLNQRVIRALRRLRGDSEGGDMAKAWNNEVLDLLGGSGSTVVEPSVRAISAKTADYTITTADIEAGTSFTGSPSAASMTFTLPASSGWTGRSVRIANTAALSSGKTVVVDGNASETVAGNATITLNEGDAYTFESNGSNVIVY